MHALEVTKYREEGKQLNNYEKRSFSVDLSASVHNIDKYTQPQNTPGKIYRPVLVLADGHLFLTLGLKKKKKKGNR